MKSSKACTLLLSVICDAKNGAFAIFLDAKSLEALVAADLVKVTGSRPGARIAKPTANGRIVRKALSDLGSEPAAVRPRVSRRAAQQPDSTAPRHVH